MSFWHGLYLLIIYPLQMLFEIAFSMISKHVSNYGYAIIWLSLIVNIAIIPLYFRADKIQNEQRAIEAKLNPGIKHIRKAFSGDERFMMLQMFYKINNYSPIMSLRSATSLLLEIPFFMAAYDLLSSLHCLNGVSFWFMKDLSQPDALFHIGSFSINILPILMTLINVLSGLVYTKGHSLREKIQVNGMALIFLVLLYNSASGLAFYWTLNNVFSLIKNLVTFVFTKLIHVDARKIEETFSKILKKVPDSNKATGIRFELSQIAKVVLMGFFIPVVVYVDSPLEYISPFNFDNPLSYLLPSVLIGFGLLVVWESIIYFLLPSKGKTIFYWISIGTFMVYMADYFYVLDLMRKYEAHIPKGLTYAIVIILSLVLIFIVNKLSKFLLSSLLTISIVFITAMGFMTFNEVNEHIREFNPPVNRGPVEFNLSKDGQNVVVIMLDRAVGYTMPYELEMFPELRDMYDGFTFYPNTISYGAHTNYASPALFGGYEYTPEMLNARFDESLELKQNEALKMLPALFSSEGYDVTVIDPPYAGYECIPETNIYDDLDGVNAFYTGEMFNPYSDITNTELQNVRERDFFLYGLCNCLVYGRDIIYDNGNYNNPNRYILNDNKLEYYLDLNGESYKALDRYFVLDGLTSMTNIKDDDSDNLLVFQNEFTHSNPVPGIQFMEFGFDIDKLYEDLDTLCPNNKDMKAAFITNISSAYMLGEWFEYLKANDVYDNTRIIIVSDHGYQYNFWTQNEMECYNPLLLYKDFNSTGFSISEDFMTNADTPYLAVNDVIDNPINPYTGKPVTNESKYVLPVKIDNSNDFIITYNNNNTFTNDYYWYYIDSTDDIFNPDNWRYIMKEG